MLIQSNGVEQQKKLDGLFIIYTMVIIAIKH